MCVGRGLSDAQWMPTDIPMPGAKPRSVLAPLAPMSTLSGIMKRGPGRCRRRIVVRPVGCGCGAAR